MNGILGRVYQVTPDRERFKREVNHPVIQNSFN
jgi:hypothetical protein